MSLVFVVLFPAMSNPSTSDSNAVTINVGALSNALAVAIQQAASGSATASASSSGQHTAQEGFTANATNAATEESS